MKIIIIGAGISGLSTYLCLKKHLKDATTAPTTTTTPTTASATTKATAAAGRQPTSISIVIYEAYDVKANTHIINKKDAGSDSDQPVFTPEAIGAAIGLSSNGLNVLSRMENNKKILREMMNRGHPMHEWKISNARGWNLVDVKMASPGQKAGVAANDEEIDNNNRKTKVSSAWAKPATSENNSIRHSIMIARQTAWEVLRDAVQTDEGAIRQKKVVEIVIGDEQKLNVVKFSDGTEDIADLVIGADGLKSAVRSTMFKDYQSGSKNRDDSLKDVRGWLYWLSWLWRKPPPKSIDYVKPHYEGLVGVGSFVPSELLKSNNQKPGIMSLVFGPNGFFGYGYISSATAKSATTSDSAEFSVPIESEPGPVAAWWSTFASPTPYPFPPRDKSSDETPNKPWSFNSDAALASLQARHKHWKNPHVQAIVKYAAEHGLNQIYPTWTTPELPHWQMKGRVVLVGDAAHALQPSSGQGACQGLEDAEALSLFVAHYVNGLQDENGDNSSKSTAAAIEAALIQFERLRMPRVHAIYERTQRMSGMKANMNVVQEMMMYGFVWAMKFFYDKYNDELMNYDLPAAVEEALRKEMI